MDGIDRELIALLRANSRTPVLELARVLRLSRGTIQKRLARLEQEHVILGYTIKVDANDLPHQLRAVMNIALDGNTAADVQNKLRALPCVNALYTTNGRWDLIAEIRAENVEKLNQILGMIRQIPGISTSETNILLSTLKV